jgi:serine/threonine-protein kinase
MKTYPPTATTYQLPQDGNDHHPVFSPDGQELFYVGGAGIFGSVRITTQPSLSFGSPVRALRSGFATQSGASVRTYDVLPDGKRFVGVVNAGQAQIGQASAQIQVVLNWFEDLKQRVPVP